tara:strand:- start:3102 stop:3380 length:279 start_codon:yes stop_codon:yes gene_type:complete
MKKFRIFSANYCSYCKQAIMALTYKGAHYEVFDVSQNEVARMLLQEKTGMTTVPQIFFGNRIIGGCSDLLAMDESGELDILIKGEDNATDID